MIYGIEYNNLFADNSQYEFKLKNDKISMSYFGESWTEHTIGKTTATLKDTQNGININIDNKKLKLDYAEAEELYVLLTYYMKEVQDYTPTIYKMEKTIVD